ncbi:MAG: VIT1/CCC1 transporter family protein [Elusimicrobiota bacterium]
MNEESRKLIIKIQKAEITEHFVYKKLAPISARKDHAEILERISAEELEHYVMLEKITGEKVGPSLIRVFFYSKISSILGLNFGLKLMESGERNAQKVYDALAEFPQARKIMQEEKEHEKKIISLIDEEILTYVSSVVLGLNDALVELTGALTGFTLALQNSRLVAVVGFITGLAAAMSMGVSNYLSVKHEEGTEKSPFRSAGYTFMAYLITVFILITPYLMLDSIHLSLAMVIIFALLIIAFFNFYASVSKGLNFKERFIEMTTLSLSVAAINYAIGLLIKRYLSVDI